jgi:pSer/pThr/pTyr-binding forkhead associated (FHA) protein
VPETGPISEPASGVLVQVKGRLIVRSSGADIPLPHGKAEATMGRSDPVRGIFPDVDLTRHGGESGGVSRLHARLIAEGTQMYIEDLNSTNYTFLNRQRLQAEQRYLLANGDEIRLGLLVLEYRE